MPPPPLPARAEGESLGPSSKLRCLARLVSCSGANPLRHAARALVYLCAAEPCADIAGGYRPRRRLPGRTGGQGNGVRTTYSLTEGKRREVTLRGLNEMRRKQVGDPGRGRGQRTRANYSRRERGVERSFEKAWVKKGNTFLNLPRNNI